MSKLTAILLEIIPVLVMIGLVSIFSSDYLLLAMYLVIVAGAFLVKYEKRDYVFFFFGLIVMPIFELVFLGTGAETFSRKSFLGVMPIWLPVLWAYSFVVIRRAVKTIDREKPQYPIRK